jgi:hypothetical protein
MKKNKNINWPVGTFTIAELIEQNDHIIPITLRVRLKKMIDKGTVSELGTLPSEMGRPKMLLTKDELTNDVLKEAKLKDVCFKDKYQNMIDELSVTVKSSHEVDDSDEVETEWYCQRCAYKNYNCICDDKCDFCNSSRYICPHCDREYDIEDKTCEYCGYELEVQYE